jgi:hypothetical protein
MTNLVEENVNFLTQNEMNGNVVSLERFGVCEGNSCYFKLYFRGDLDPREQKYSFRHDDSQPEDWKDGYCQLRALLRAFHSSWTQGMREGRLYEVPSTCMLRRLDLREPSLSFRFGTPQLNLYEWGKDWVLQGTVGYDCNVARFYQDLQRALDFMFEMIGKEGRSRERQDERLEADDLQGLANDDTDSYFYRKMEDTMINEAEQYMLGNFIETEQDKFEKSFEVGNQLHTTDADAPVSTDNNNVEKEELPF